MVMSAMSRDTDPGSPETGHRHLHHCQHTRIPPVTPSASSMYSSTVLADAPEGYWRLGDSGSAAADASGRSRAGTYRAG